MTDRPHDFMTAKEVAEELRISTRQVHRLRLDESSPLSGVKIGKRTVRYTRESVNATKQGER